MLCLLEPEPVFVNLLRSQESISGLLLKSLKIPSLAIRNIFGLEKIERKHY
jgi:hypothetical protein